MSAEACPLSGRGNFYYGQDIPEVCRETCETIWDSAISHQKVVEHEEYPPQILPEEAEDCEHFVTETGNTSLQSQPNNNGERFYGITEFCMGCCVEIAEDWYVFICPNN